jgi:adenine-specific DNA methylase
VLFTKALREANFAVFNNHKNNRAWNYSIRDLPQEEEGFDLIYLDPPYISPGKVGVDYRGFYHFLEGICNYNQWVRMIDFKSKHRRLKVQRKTWTNGNQITQEFEDVIEKFQDSILAISYRDPGIPSISTLEEILSSYKNNIDIHTTDYKYALTSRKKRAREVLIVAS